MAQEAISASSRFWDDKQIALTENTENNIAKKAYTLDAELLFAQYNLEGNDAVEAAKQNGVSPDQLIANPNSYTFLAMSAVNDLKTNASKDSRVSAVQALTKLGFTNIYEANTKNFITPPEEPAEEKPVQQPEQEEEEPRYQYTRRVRPAPQQQEPQETYQEPVREGPSPRATLSGAARFIPNAVRQALPMRGPNTMTPAKMAPTSFVRPGRDYAIQKEPKARQIPKNPDAPTHVQYQRPLLNAGMAAKLGASRFAKKAPEKLAPRPKFGLSVRRNH